MPRCFAVKVFFRNTARETEVGVVSLTGQLWPQGSTTTPFYEKVYNVLVTLEKKIRDKTTFKFTSKAIYFSETVASPLLHPFWRAFTGPALDIKTHWPLVRDSITENYNSDVAWLITLKGIKVRDSLRSWGYIASDACAYCKRKETIDHCFLNCKRAMGVWSPFSPTLSALLATPFSVNVKTGFFHLWPSVGDRVDRLARFIIKTVLYSIWSFRNKTTFYNRTDMSGLLYGTSGTTLPCACELIICASLRIILRLCETTPVFVKFQVPNLKLL